MDGRAVHGLVLLLLVHFTAAQLYEGERCTMENGSRGVCRSVPACPAAREEITRGNLPKICSFANHAPIVCCADNATPTRRPTTRVPPTVRTPPTTQRTPPTTRRTPPTTPRVRPTTQAASSNYFDDRTIAGRKCREYGRYVYWERELPTLSIIPQIFNVTECYLSVETLIVNGVAAEPKEFPHMAALGYGPENGIQYKCGGSLISERFIITAAHCLSARGFGPVSWARLGDLNINSALDDTESAITMKISERFKHDGYKPPAHYNDIALLKLETDVTFSPYVRPACLYTMAHEPHTLNATATGWGKLQFDEDVGSDTLMKVSLAIQDPSRCNHTYRSLIQFGNKLKTGIDPQSMICAGDPKGQRDTCGGDSGGPLQIGLKEPYCMYSIYGLTSFGVVACGLGDNPAVYTRVSNYISWIEQIVWPQNQ